MTRAVQVVGYVVAGGRSSRMGQDKAGLLWRGSTLLMDAVRRLGAVTTEVRVLSGSEQPGALPGIPMVPDVEPLQGPLGALRTALEDAFPRPVLLLAVDLPFVPSALLERLVASSSGFDAVIPHSPTGAEPLAAFYCAACLEPVRRRLAVGERRMSAFWPEVHVRHIESGEQADLGDPGHLFANLNTPEDVARFRP